ncbi:sensor histidine kinase [Geosporobacter ferrireducens]|uniref:histidine kinase n=1 Tax=Geosporobacter ferrireducens TaxID=1424294 RepID=A0A1D8GJX5_9FIRM|nr:sensor histidine kinase [Geosporobacter ferrireducens]AOT71217.1 hypothetical protein Gferi_17660 [Geosporobacter ferrireducens]
MTLSLRRRITLTICSIIIFLLILLSGFIYTKSASILNQDAETYMQSQLERAQESIDLRIRIHQLETEKLALDARVLEFLKGYVSTSKMNTYLTTLMQKKNVQNKQYMDFFILNTEGIITTSTMPEAMYLDLSTREYFRQSVLTGQTITSDILIARSDESLIVITVSPICNNLGEVIAYAGTAIHAEFLSDTVKDLKLGKTGYFIIVDSNNLILSHPDKSLIATDATNTVFALPERLLSKEQWLQSDAAKKRIITNQNGFQELQLYKKMKSNRWVLIAMLPKYEVHEKSVDLLGYVILIGASVTLGAMLIGIYISNRISTPIVAITEYMNRAVKSNLMLRQSVSDSIKNLTEEDNLLNHETSPLLHPSDEIGNLSRSLKNLKDHFVSTISRFERESEELIKSSQELSSTIEDNSYRTGNFISTLSHDLKTSITLIKGYVKGISSDIIEDPAMQKHFLQEIYNSTIDIEKITCDILDSAYEAQWSQKLHLEAVDAVGFAEQLFEAANHYINHSERSFKGSFQCNSGCLLIDTIKIKRVWNNLLNNAVKFSKKGSLIQVMIAQHEEALTFKIIDTGIGIPDEEKEKIFDMFYRGQNLKTKGYGLGLFISRSILEAHNVSLNFYSEYQKGSTFWFSLPINREDL